MDVSKDETPVAVLQLKSFATETKLRPVLVTSRKNNAVPSNGKPGTREVMPRYKSATTSTPQSMSPKASQASPMARISSPKRAQSTERRRPSSQSSPTSRCSAPSSPTSRASPSSTSSSSSSAHSSPSSKPSTPFSAPTSRSSTPVRDLMVERLSTSRRSLVSKAPDGLWPSIRNLSSSFQSESSSSLLSAKNDRTVRNPSPDRTLKLSERPIRNPSPDRALKSSTNAVPERKKTPLRGRNASEQSENSKPVENSHARTIDQLRWPAMSGGKVSSNALSTKSVDLTDKISRSASLLVAARRFSPTRRMSSSDVLSFQSSMNEAARPVSSSGSEKSLLLKRSARNITPLSLERDTSVARPSSSMSPVPSLIRSSSPNRTSQTLSSRGLLSPCRTRPSTPFSPSSSASPRTGVSSSVFNYISDVQKGKRSPSHMEDVHQLRLLYNRDLQWHFVNAQANAAFSAHKLLAEEMLYNVWNITSELHNSIISKKIEVQKLKQELKLKLMLKEQIEYLEGSSALEAEHSSALSGTIVALKARTVRLPVAGGARADVRAVKNAVSSAVDVMQAMGSSICHLMSRVQGTNAMVSELSGVAATESIMLDECRELLASAAAMQVQELSLRTHLIQLKQNVEVE